MPQCALHTSMGHAFSSTPDSAKEPAMSRLHRRDFLKNSSAAGFAAAALLAGRQAAKAWAGERVRVGVVGAAGRGAGAQPALCCQRQCRNCRDCRYRQQPLRPGRGRRHASCRAKQPRTVKRFSHDRRRSQNRRPRRRHARPLARHPHDPGLPGGQGRVRRKAGRAQHRRRPADGRSPAQARPDRADGFAAPQRPSGCNPALEYIREGHLGRCLVAKAWESTQARLHRPPRRQRAARRRRLRHVARVRARCGRSTSAAFTATGAGSSTTARATWATTASTASIWPSLALNAACEAQGDQPLGLPTRISPAAANGTSTTCRNCPTRCRSRIEFGGQGPRLLTYEMRVWAPYRCTASRRGPSFMATRAYIVLGNRRWRRLRSRRTSSSKRSPATAKPSRTCRISSTASRSRKKPACDLETIGHPASILCHAGNISARLGRKLFLDPATETFIDDEEANALRTRPEYRKPWVLPEV